MYTTLIVDDEALSLRGIKFLLNQRNEQFTLVGEARNGKEGILLARQRQPNLIITDIYMPHMDGLEMAAELPHVCPNSRVLVVSGYDNFQYAQRAIRARVVDYLLKPLKEKEFFRALDNFAMDMCAPPAPETKAEEGCRLVIRKSAAYIRSHFGSDITLKLLADQAGMSQGYFSTLFKTEMGLTYQEYLLSQRMASAKQYLRTTNMKVSQIAQLVGYYDSKHFHMMFKKLVGVTPAQYREMDAAPGDSLPTA